MTKSQGRVCKGEKTNMKTKLILLLALLTLISAHAHELTFFGVVDASTKFPRGSAFSVTVCYNPVNGIIQEYDLKVGPDFDLRGTKGGGSVALDNDPTHGSVYYQIINSDFMETTLYTPTPTGMIPNCVVDFNIAEFSLFNNPLMANTSGHLTSLPILR